jgi:hypothetical protein
VRVQAIKNQAVPRIETGIADSGCRWFRHFSELAPKIEKRADSSIARKNKVAYHLLKVKRGLKSAPFSKCVRLRIVQELPFKAGCGHDPKKRKKKLRFGKMRARESAHESQRKRREMKNRVHGVTCVLRRITNASNRRRVAVMGFACGSKRWVSRQNPRRFPSAFVRPGQTLRATAPRLTRALYGQKKSIKIKNE